MDFFMPNVRKTTKTNENISGDYKKMIPVVATNLIVSLPVFSFFEYYLLNQPDIKNNIYNYPWFVYILSWMFLGDLFFLYNS